MTMPRSTVVPFTGSPLLRLGVSSLAYCAFQAVAFLFPNTFGLISAIWPAAGIALAALLLNPQRLWPALLACLFVAGLAANLTTARPALASLGFMLANICETSASAWLITRLCGTKVRFTRVREVIALAGAVFLVNSVTSLIGAETASLVSGARFWKFYWTWWVADGLGLLLVTPLIVIWAHSNRPLAGLRWKRAAEAAVLLALGCAVGIIEFGWKGEFIAVELAPYWLPVLLIWAAVRFGPLLTVTLLGVFAVIVIGCTTAGHGSYLLGGTDATLRLLSVQTYLGVMGLTGLVLAASIAQQKENRALLHAVVEGTSDAICVKDRQGQYVFLNSAAAQFLGRTAAEVVGQDDTFLFPAEEAAALMKADRALLAAPGPATNEEGYAGKSGEPLFFLTTKGPLRSETGEAVGLFSIARDVTARIQVEAELRKHDERYRAMLETTINGFYLSDLQGRLLDVNETYCRMSGYSAPELLAMRIADLEVVETEADTAAHIKSIMAQGEDRFETRHRRKDGSLFDLEASVRHFPADGGRLLVFMQDITVRKLAERTLRESEEKFAKVFRNAPVLIVLSDMAGGTCLDVNEEVLRASGFTREEIIGHSAVELGWLTAEERARLIQGVLAHGRVNDLEISLRMKTGEVRNGLVSAETTIIGGRSCLLTVTADITGQKRAEAALRASEQRYRSILNASPDDITITDLEGHILMVSPAALRMFGYELAEEFMGRPVIDCLVPEERKRASSNIALLFQGIKPGTNEYHGLRRDGSTFDMEVNSEVIRDAMGQPNSIVFVARDITARKLVEATRAEALNRLEKIASQVPGVVYQFRLRPDGTFCFPYASDGIRGIYGVSPQEVREDAALAFSRHHPDDVAGILATIRKSAENLIPWVHEYRLLSAGGRVRWLSGNAQPQREADGSILWHGFVTEVTTRKQAEQALHEAQISTLALMENIPDRIYFKDTAGRFLRINSAVCRALGDRPPAEIIGKTDADFFVTEHAVKKAADEAEIIRTGAPQADIEEKEIWPDGSVTWVVTTKLPLRDGQGRVMGICGISRDITARKAADGALQASLLEKEALLKEVHHRVKNNLQVITSLLRLEAARSAEPGTKSVLGAMQGRIRSMALLHEGLYRSSTFAAIDLGAYLRQITNQAFRSLAVSPGCVQLHMDVASVIVGLEQATPCGLLVNELISNCLKHAFPAGRTGEMKVELHVVDGGPRCRLCVSDTGIGLPADFDAKRGKSLGLLLVSDLARQIGGTLEIGPAPAAVFTVCFTAAGPQAKLA